MDHLPEPSLENRALLTIALALWNKSCISIIIGSDRFSYNNLIKEIMFRVKKNIHQLPLLESFKNKVLQYVVGIGRQIVLFQGRDLFHVEYILTNFKELRWTQYGTIDAKKTADIFAYDITTTGLCKCFQIACTFCLENHIHALQKEIPKKWKMNLRLDNLAIFWYHYVSGTLDKLPEVRDSHGVDFSPYIYAFETSAKSGNVVGTEYFFQKLTFNEKQNSALKMAKCLQQSGFYSRSHGETEVLLFLLSQMETNEQIEIFKCENSSFTILEYFLEWPRQPLFMTTANRLWDFISESEYHRFLCMISIKILHGYEDYDYKSLFSEFWQRGTGYRNMVPYCLINLIEIGDERNVSLILADVSDEAKKNYILTEGSRLCREKLFSEKPEVWKLLAYTFQQCLVSEEVAEQFKDDLQSYMTFITSLRELSGTWGSNRK